MARPCLVTAYLRWALARSACARGWWLTTAVYLVVDASLEPFQLVLIGTFQGLVVLVAEVPAGVLADRVSRRLALVLAHLVSGGGMAMAAAVDTFPALVVANCLWGVGWAFASGADVAWLTDEHDQHEPADEVDVDVALAAQGRWELLGAPVGIVAFGALAWATSLATAMASAGIAMAMLAIVVVKWPERARRHAHAPVVTWRSIVHDALRLARYDRVLLVLLASNALLNGSAEAYGRLHEHRFVTLGLPTGLDPIVWFTALGIATVALRVASLRIVERRVPRRDTPRRAYVVACAVGAVGLVLFSLAPTTAAAVAASLVVTGLGAIPRVAVTIRVNRRATAGVRATVHSVLSWSENAGEITLGLALALVSAATSATVALLGAAVLLALAAVTGNVRDNPPVRGARAGKSLCRLVWRMRRTP